MSLWAWQLLPENSGLHKRDDGISGTAARDTGDLGPGLQVTQGGVFVGQQGWGGLRTGISREISASGLCRGCPPNS